MEDKLVVVIMGQNCEKHISMCSESVKDADAIVYCDGGSTDSTVHNLLKKGFCNKRTGGINQIGESYTTFNECWSIIYNEYNQQDPKMNGKQRNFYLDYIKKNYPDYWCLALDADEVVDTNGIINIKKFINSLPTERSDTFFSVKMRHFIGDLGHEDSTQPIHFVPHRLFKIRDDLSYPEVEHPVLNCPNVKSENVIITTIWHMAYCPNMWDIKKRYDNHMKKSNMHSPEFLKNWYNAHLFGKYPKTEINLLDIPEVILNTFNIDKDELYFQNRTLETKHFIDAMQWRDFFKCYDEIEIGCGIGPRVFAMNGVGIKTWGIEKSKFAIMHKMSQTIEYGDITNYEMPNNFDLAVAYDVLEHIEDDKINIAIENLIKLSKKHILISIPYKGTSNCDADSTHKIKENREWWLNKFLDKGLKEVKVPEHFLFKEQLLIFEK
jgi:hypothetical protein